MYYFAYGSNMDLEDFKRWCDEKGCEMPDLRDPIPAKLLGYKLVFNYYSGRRKAGAANISLTGESGDVVYGLIFNVTECARDVIREKEGYPDYYGESCVKVKSLDDKLVFDGFTYKVVPEKERDTYQPPTKCYLGLIIKNAKLYKFPKDYIECLSDFSTCDKKCEE